MPKIEPTIVPDSEVTPEIPSTISINGVDYDPTDVQSLIDLGSKTRDLEKQWNTPVDTVWPEFGKSREELKTTQQQLADAQTKLQTYEAKKDAGTETAADTQMARKAAKELGIILDEDLDSRGYIKKDELDSYLDQRIAYRDEAKKVLDNAYSLEKEIDGSDGRPAFSAKAVLAYGSSYGIPDLKAAYEDMYKSQLDAWKTKQVTNQRSKGIDTLSPGGAKAPTLTKVTDDNIKAMLGEALGDGSSE